MKNLKKMFSLLFALILIFSSCGEKEKANKKNESDKEAICNLIKEQNKLFNDILEFAYQNNDGPETNPEINRAEISRIEKELERLETESDKYVEARDGRTEEDVEANIQTMMNCPEFNQELMQSEELLSALKFICQFFEGPCPVR
tara:strand:- start:2975 stop:3409 length:435 start_codon:yes stop_codon:yes gene_type:complete